MPRPFCPCLLALPLALGVGLIAAGPTDGDKKPDKPAPKAEAPQAAAPSKEAKPVLDHKMKLIDGAEQNLADYKGKVVLIVNTASKCGYTPQYAGLEKLYESRKDKGLVILGFPANNFRGQEPGSNADIATFCKASYGVTFPMFEKVSVVGDDATPLFKQLAADPSGGEPKWNFTKYLVGRDGRLVAKYDSKVKPDDAELTKKIDELLAAGGVSGAAPSGKS